ncbi:MAG: hypothetical protein NC548_06440 [Lachnospiraceae bacterium]|nr:hypothetical protein [Lachnospiraceae bacterium]
MALWKFRDIENLEDFLLDTVGIDYLLPGSNHNEVIYFANGDKMTIDLSTGKMNWEPIRPGSFSTSRLALRLHQWFGKGIIHPIDNEEES